MSSTLRAKRASRKGRRLVEGGVALHISCHSRAQNMGQKGADLLALLPQADVAVVERCSGHGGAWGCKTGNFETALKVGKPAARQMQSAGKRYIVSRNVRSLAFILRKGSKNSAAKRRPRTSCASDRACCRSL